MSRGEPVVRPTPSARRPTDSASRPQKPPPSTCFISSLDTPLNPAGTASDLFSFIGPLLTGPPACTGAIADRRQAGLPQQCAGPREVAAPGGVEPAPASPHTRLSVGPRPVLRPGGSICDWQPTPRPAPPASAGYGARSRR